MDERIFPLLAGHFDGEELGGGGKKTFAGEHRAQLLDKTDRETRGRWEEKKVRRGKKSITRSPGGVSSRQQHRREPHMVLVGVAGPLSAGLSQPLLLAAAYLSASFFPAAARDLVTLLIKDFGRRQEI